MSDVRACDICRLAVVGALRHRECALSALDAAEHRQRSGSTMPADWQLPRGQKSPDAAHLDGDHGPDLPPAGTSRRYVPECAYCVERERWRIAEMAWNEDSSRAECDDARRRDSEYARRLADADIDHAMDTTREREQAERDAERGGR